MKDVFTLPINVIFFDPNLNVCLITNDSLTGNADSLTGNANSSSVQSSNGGMSSQYDLSLLNFTSPLSLVTIILLFGYSKV